jgi:hypothetical protein
MVRWDASSSQPLFLHKSSVALLREQLEFGEVALQGILKHSNGWEGLVSIDASGLLVAGTMVADGCVGTVVPKPVEGEVDAASASPEAAAALALQKEQVLYLSYLVLSSDLIFLIFFS